MNQYIMSTHPLAFKCVTVSQSQKNNKICRGKRVADSALSSILQYLEIYNVDNLIQTNRRFRAYTYRLQTLYSRSSFRGRQAPCRVSDRLEILRPSFLFPSFMMLLVTSWVYVIDICAFCLHAPCFLILRKNECVYRFSTQVKSRIPHALHMRNAYSGFFSLLLASLLAMHFANIRATCRALSRLMNSFPFPCDQPSRLL